jgi:hypothetical protein
MLGAFQDDVFDKQVTLGLSMLRPTAVATAHLRLPDFPSSRMRRYEVSACSGLQTLSPATPILAGAWLTWSSSEVLLEAKRLHPRGVVAYSYVVTLKLCAMSIAATCDVWTKVDMLSGS